MCGIEEVIFRASRLVPERLTPIESWHQHLPFGYALVALVKPKILVELGTHMGDSYCTFCQSALENQTGTRCFAVDTWEGDQHVGPLNEDVLRDLREHHDPRYAEFSQLLQMTFDRAALRFDDGGVDFLHIDGLHTEEAVRHDYEVWRPKMSAQGIILFHDIAVRKNDFGVHKLWAELKNTFPSIEFEHGNGLGVLLTGAEQPKWLTELSEASHQKKMDVQRVFATLGERLYAKRHLELHRTTHDELWKHIREYERLLGDSRAAYSNLTNTFSWKITRPLRAVRRLIGYS